MSVTNAASAAMYSRLVTASGLDSTKVLAHQPTRQDIPCVVYALSAREGERVLGQAESTGASLGFDVDIWSTSFATMRVLQDDIIAGLEGLRGTTTTAAGTVYIHDITIDSADDRSLLPMPGEPDGLYRASLTLTMLVTN